MTVLVVEIVFAFELSLECAERNPEGILLWLSTLIEASELHQLPLQICEVLLGLLPDQEVLSANVLLSQVACVAFQLAIVVAAAVVGAGRAPSEL